MYDFWDAKEYNVTDEKLNLELRRKIILYKPELHWSPCVLQDSKYHDFREAFISAKSKKNIWETPINVCPC